MNSVQSFIEHLLSFRHGDKGDSAPAARFSKVLPIGKMLALPAPNSVAEMWLEWAPLDSMLEEHISICINCWHRQQPLLLRGVAKISPVFTLLNRLGVRCQEVACSEGFFPAGS